jgi:protease-4
MAKRRDIVIGVVIFFAFAGFVFFTVVALMGVSEEGSFEFPAMGKRIAIIEVEGPIYSSKNVVRQIKKYTEDNSVPAIVLRVDSPGGGVAASQEIYSQLLRAKDEGKIIVASMGSVAASGGLYIAMAADTVVANPGTLTGSIGVIFQYQTIDELANKIGVKTQVIKSGVLKDVGSMWREPTEEDFIHLQSVIDDTYDQFVNVVAEGRRMEIQDILPLADGRIFTGRQALEADLVDVLGDLDDALDIAASMAGMDAPPRTIIEVPRSRATVWDLLGKLVFDLVPGITSEGFAGPQLLFLYH